MRYVSFEMIVAAAAMLKAPMHHTVFSLDTTTGKGGSVGVAVEMARTLVEHGADVNPVDKWGKTPYQNLTSEEFAKKADLRRSTG